MLFFGLAAILMAQEEVRFIGVWNLEWSDKAKAELDGGVKAGEITKEEVDTLTFKLNFYSDGTYIFYNSEMQLKGYWAIAANNKIVFADGFDPNVESLASVGEYYFSYDGKTLIIGNMNGRHFFSEIGAIVLRK